MSHGRQRRRGSGGHPSRVAERRARGMQRAQPSPEQTLARALADMGSELDRALDVEIWISQVLGTFESARFGLPLTEGATITDSAFEYGSAPLRALSRLDAPGAAVAMRGFAEVDAGELGMLASGFADDARVRYRLPRWAADIGESAIVGAAVMSDPVFDDGRTVFLESRHADGATLAVGVYVNDVIGGCAKNVLLAESIDEVAAIMDAHRGEDVVELSLDRIEPGVAAGLIAEAIALTDSIWDPPVDEDYWAGRALAQLRADQTSHVVTPSDRAELSQSERDRLRREFLESPEGAAFDADGDDAFTALLAIDFAADHAGGDPLRWSPQRVELFMTAWVPHKVLAPESLLAALPRALDAWVRFAARRRGVPDAALALTRSTISECEADMREAAADPEAGGPTTRFLRAARDAGVEVEDPAALEAFVAGWDARSERGLDAPGDDLVDDVLQLKIALKGVSKPPVWRRLQVPATTPLDELHLAIQVAFGWTNSHLHCFEASGERFGPADPELDLEFADERRFTLADLVSTSDRVTYSYDFGDDWEHEIRVEEALAREPGATYPVLVTAKGLCPPEDCGGAWGWADLKDAVADPGHPQHEELREWLGLADGDVLDPTAVDVSQIRSRIGRLAGTLR